MKKIPFSPPRMDQAVIDEVTDALLSGWITTGPKTKELERELEKFTGVKKVLCVNSATGGMELMLRYLGIGEGDEVIIPAYTYCATANVVIHVGAKPIMVDINADDFTIDIQKISEAITKKTKAIIPVDLGGMPIDYDILLDVLENKKNIFEANSQTQKMLGRIAIITDAAHSIGSKYKDLPAAQKADTTVFSFHAVKNMTTAEGGAICLNFKTPFDANEIYKQLNTKSLHGQNKDALAKFGEGNAWEYDVIEAGYKLNMPDILAAIGLVGIRRYEKDTLVKRRSIFDAYQKAFKQYEWAELPVFETEEKQSSYHLFLLRIKGINLATRNKIIQNVFAKGVSVNVHYKPLPLLSFYKNQGYEMNDYPVSLDCFERVITLPVFYDLTTIQLQTVVDVIVASVEEIV